MRRLEDYRKVVKRLKLILENIVGDDEKVLMLRIIKIPLLCENVRIRVRTELN